MRNSNHMSLAHKKCASCEDKGTKAISRDEAYTYLSEVPGWELSSDAKEISKEFVFDTFIGSIEFINQVADIAEMEGHHPDIYCFFNKVKLSCSTHSISGLTENDFILASKIDGMLM